MDRPRSYLFTDVATAWDLIACEIYMPSALAMQYAGGKGDPAFELGSSLLGTNKSHVAQIREKFYTDCTIQYNRLQSEDIRGSTKVTSEVSCDSNLVG